jgi:molybdate/tungstate transport system substrate-binding protein
MPIRVRRLAAVAVLPVVLVACSKSTSLSSKASSAAATTAAPATTTTAAAAKGSGPVDVLYAGSLADLMEKQIGPAFNTATGYTFTGFGGDSGDLATEIKGKVRQGDVFISANPAVDGKLEGAANGNWVSWYATFATAPLVLGYNPQSKFASDLTSKPWYQVITEPGFRIGRTDPATDPKGALAVTALTNAATADNAPGLTAITSSTSNIYPETSLVGQLQAGQLDAGFFYATEAKAANIPTVPLTGQTLKATYTITVLNNAPDEAGAEAFVQYLLGSAGVSTLQSTGFTLVTPPTVTGTGVPSSLSGLFGS